MSGLTMGDDPYFHYWLATLVPIYDAGGVMEKLFRANAWVSRRLPGFKPRQSADERAVPPAPRWSGVFLPLLKALDRPLGAVQAKGFPSRIRELVNRDSRVVVSDSILKFHVNDRREKYGRLFEERLKALEYEIAH